MNKYNHTQDKPHQKKFNPKKHNSDRRVRPINPIKHQIGWAEVTRTSQGGVLQTKFMPVKINI